MNRQYGWIGVRNPVSGPDRTPRRAAALVANLFWNPHQISHCEEELGRWRRWHVFGFLVESDIVEAVSAAIVWSRCVDTGYASRNSEICAASEST
jgi:hypothetical protein